MPATQDRHIFAEFFRTYEILSRTVYVGSVLERDLSQRGHTISDRDLQQSLMQLFEPHLGQSAIDQSAFGAALLKIAQDGTTIEGELPTDFDKLHKALLQRLLRNTKAFDSLRGMASSHYGQLRDSICNIPNSLEKARDLLRGLVMIACEDNLVDPCQKYDAMVFLSDELEEHIPRKIFSLWKEEYRRLTDKDITQLFWKFRTGFEGLDAISHHRFRERFGLAGFDHVFEEAEDYLEKWLIDASDLPVRVFGCRASFDAAMLLWQISRSGTLSKQLVNAISITLQRLSKGEIPKEWARYYRRVENGDQETLPSVERYTFATSTIGVPSTTAIALTCVAFLKLDTERRYREKILAAVQWLSEYQNADGSWCSEVFRGTGTGRHLTVESDFLTTLLSVEAIFRSGLPNTRLAVELGWNWILGEQNELGGWDSEMVDEKKDWLPFPLNTVLVLELNELLKLPVQPDRVSGESQIRDLSSIFLAYSRQDWTGFAEPLTKRLKDEGFPVWVDQHLLRVGHNWLDEVNKALRQCSYMILCVSPSAINSKWVKMEYRYYLEHNKPIFPVICKPTDMPAELQGLQHGPYDDFAGLLRSIHDVHETNQKG